MGEDAGALGGVELHRLELVALRPGHAVELGEPFVEEEIVGLEKLAVVGAIAPDHVLDEFLQRFPQVGQDRLVEIRIGLLVLAHVLGLLDGQPLVEELPEFGARPWVLHHPRGLQPNLVGRADLALGRGFAQGLVRQRIPKSQGQP